jgi:hypothetical protein
VPLDLGATDARRHHHDGERERRSQLRELLSPPGEELCCEPVVRDGWCF